jgi:hypothetical protein
MTPGKSIGVRNQLVSFFCGEGTIDVSSFFLRKHWKNELTLIVFPIVFPELTLIVFPIADGLKSSSGKDMQRKLRIVRGRCPGARQHRSDFRSASGHGLAGRLQSA